jgi:hypothetical protein
MVNTIDKSFADNNNSESDDLNYNEMAIIAKSKPYDIESVNNDDLLELESNASDVKHESSDVDSDSDSESSFPSFGAKLKPKFVEFSIHFPPYPKTHAKGVAHVIELSPELLADEEKLRKFRTALQYSMTKGHGIKTRHNVPFFSIDGDDVPMNYFYRQCNGIHF